LLDGLGIAALLVVEIGIEQQAGLPMTPFMGVRISWLMVARKSDLAALAASAASLA
jgi:hypothetical protein